MSSTLGCPLTNCKRRFVTENVSSVRSPREYLYNLPNNSFQDLRKHIEHHMSPPKPKKQQTTSTNKGSEFKPEETHNQTYPSLYFNPSLQQSKN